MAGLPIDQAFDRMLGPIERRFDTISFFGFKDLFRQGFVNLFYRPIRMSRDDVAINLQRLSFALDVWLDGSGWIDRLSLLETNKSINVIAEIHGAWL